MNIEELENKVSKYEEEINMLKAEIAKLKKEKKPVKRWRAEKNGHYFIVDSLGDISISEELYDITDGYRYNAGQYFKTQQQAENYREKILIYQELKDLALELNNGEKIDWEKYNNQAKYYIYFNGDDECLEENDAHFFKDIGQIYCLNENFLDIAKQRIGEERLKKLFEEE